jgi:SAM-dependent methyltransferase
MNAPLLPPEDIFGNRKKIAYFLKHVDEHRARVGRPLTILDFGCGNGTAIAQFLCKGPDRYVGVDFHRPSLDYARLHFGREGAVFQQHIPDDVRFDALLYSDVIEHLSEPLELLRSHVARLASDGILLGSVPNGYGPCEIEKSLDRSLGLYGKVRWVGRGLRKLLGRTVPPVPEIPYNSESGHVQFFTRGSLERLVRDLGMTIDDFAHGGFVGADLTGATIFSSRKFLDFNVRIADQLPDWMVSTWYFKLAKKD